MIPRVSENQEFNYEKALQDYEQAKKQRWQDQLLLNRPLKVVIAIILSGVVVPVLIYQFMYVVSMELAPSDGLSTGTCLLQRTSRIPCGLGNVTEAECHLQCCYDFNSNLCFHRLPSRFSYILHQDWDEHVDLMPRIPTVPFLSQNSLRNIRLSIAEVSVSHIALTFYNSRELTLNGSRIDEKNYNYIVSKEELNVAVNALQGTIFDTLRGPFIASDNIWELSFRLTNETMYGLGEIPLKETVKVIYSHDKGLSSVPLIFAKLNGSYHGLLIDVDAPTEVIVHGENSVVVRSITSVGFKLHLFVGPEPKDVMKDVKTLIGNVENLEYWMLGLHICTEIPETTTQAFQELSTYLNNALRQNMPFDSHCGTGPIIFDTCETRDDNLDRAATLLRNRGKRFVPHLSPYIKVEEINATSVNETESRLNSNCSVTSNYTEIMLKDPRTKEVYRGMVTDFPVIYPDYENVTDDFMKYLWTYDMDVDGTVLTNNWPLDESSKNHSYTYNYLPYFSENFENAFDFTPQWNLTRFNGQRYLYSHNRYGERFVTAMKQTFENAPVWATSQFMNGAVPINRQNVDVSWTNLRRELIEASLGGISGHWLWSSPICGDNENFDRETQSPLCVKWYMAASYMPMIKIHSQSVERDPLSFVGTERNLIINALNIRQRLLPYFYTTLHEGPLLRPMFYQFPSSEYLGDLSSQFGVGDDLLIVPNLQPMQTHVHIRMPPGTWYELWSGLELHEEEGEVLTMITTDADFITLIRGGAVITMHSTTSTSADETRSSSDFTLTVALNCTSTNSTNQITLEIISTRECEAKGHLHLSKNTTIHFEADAEKITVKAEGDLLPVCGTNPVWRSNIREISIFGLSEDLNNYDNLRRITTSIDFCDLDQNYEFPFVT